MPIKCNGLYNFLNMQNKLLLYVWVYAGIFVFIVMDT